MNDTIPRLSAALRRVPRLVIAGTGGDCGKTLVSMGLVASWRQRGMKVAVFKKGPDYIDAAWLRFAAGTETRNLDTYMMGAPAVLESFQRNSRGVDICLIEGNRGLYDGSDSKGTHSTAELAKLLQAPVVLVQNITKVTRTAAATVLGCRYLDPDVKIAGVILNQVAGSRHERIVRESIETICSIPVLGAIPRISQRDFLPGRHLGLITPVEHPDVVEACAAVAELVDKHIDRDRILEVAQSAPSLREYEDQIAVPATFETPDPVSIAYFCDSAYTFYYPDNLEALSAAGAKLIPVSSIENSALPSCDGLYIGGGFPETHAGQLSDNRSLLKDVYKKAQQGLPIYAECGGLIYLCRSITYLDRTYPMAGVFPLDLQVEAAPQGHGYMEVEVDAVNPFFPVKTRFRGHEFHYSRVKQSHPNVNSIYSVERGKGCFQQRDGLIFKNVLAGFLHLHASGAPQWAKHFVQLAKEHKNIGSSDG
ncbi:MAG: cobyrinate a,c-diamide synthase [bacterium]